MQEDDQRITAAPRPTKAEVLLGAMTAGASRAELEDMWAQVLEQLDGCDPRDVERVRRLTRVQEELQKRITGESSIPTTLRVLRAPELESAAERGAEGCAQCAPVRPCAVHASFGLTCGEHPAGTVTVGYHRATGSLLVVCVECRRPFAALGISGGPAGVLGETRPGGKL